MKEMIKFFKEIFMFKHDENFKVGLAQLKEPVTPVEKAVKKPVIPQKSEVKLSDLMRRSY